MQPQELDIDIFYGYDDGYRRGMFDKCNGKPHRYGDWSAYNTLDNGFNINYKHGYDDAYEQNEVRV